MLMIRLQRMGKKKNPSYRLVISEKARDPQAKSLEILGQYDPTTNPKTINLKEERIKYWIGQGAAPSATVHNLLLAAGIISGDKKKSVAISKKRQAKIGDKKAAEAEKVKESAEKAEEEKKAAEAKVAEEKAEAEKPEEVKEEVVAEAPVEESVEPTEAPAPTDVPVEEKVEEEKKEEPAENKDEKTEEKQA